MKKRISTHLRAPKKRRKVKQQRPKLSEQQLWDALIKRARRQAIHMINDDLC